MEKRFQFSISSSVKNAAQMQPCTPELLNAALDSQQVADTCNEIAAKLQQVKKGTLTREAFETLKSKLKADNLPVHKRDGSFCVNFGRLMIISYLCCINNEKNYAKTTETKQRNGHLSCDATRN